MQKTRNNLLNKILALSLILIPFSSSTQVSTPQLKDPVKWEFSSRSLCNGEAELIFTARMEKGWHIYPTSLAGESGIPTTFSITPGSDYELLGKIVEPTPIKHHDTILDEDLFYFEKEISFRQKIKIKGSGKSVVVKGMAEYSACNDQGCLPPATAEFAIKATPATSESCSGSAEEGKGCGSVWTIFFLGFLGGFAALVTPCVFPMIPLTVSFFTKRSKSRKKGLWNAGLYALNIIIIYVLVGFSITVTLGPDALNAMAANEWMNLVFFLIFIVFGISFLGAFEITLPNSWINKADKASERGGFIGIFFMAFTLALVSFSCTGPIMGSLLVEASRGGIFCPLIGMLGFSLALALPFFLFAAFPGWLNTLPKSGGWLNNVKVVLGLLEIAFSFKFLSVTDLQGLHIGWLDFHVNGPLGLLQREIFIAFWIVIFVLIGFYLLGLFRTSHDSESKHVSIPKLIFAIFSFTFAVYMLPGMWGAPLKMISGFLPPEFYSEGWNAGGGHSGNSSGEGKISASHAKCPHGLDCFHDYDEALAYAKKVNKPLLVDFTGWSCVNCRKMEASVWSDPGVLSRIKNNFVLVSLYVDDRNALPKDQQFDSPVLKKKVKTIGEKWGHYEVARYGEHSQPLYALQDHNGRDLTTPRVYDLDVNAYIKFLDAGLEEFNKESKHKVSPVSRQIINDTVSGKAGNP